MDETLMGSRLELFILNHCKKQRVRTTEHTYSYNESPYWGAAKIKSSKIVEQPGFFKVVRPMQVFKKVRFTNKGHKGVQAIANLIIPAGTLIYADDYAFDDGWMGQQAEYRKMRASEAFVHSIASGFTYLPVQKAYSGYNDQFFYRPGETVKPAEKFSKQADQCSSGIHFFVNLKDAKQW